MKKRYIFTLLLAAICMTGGAEGRKDSRSIDFLGIPLEGPADSVASHLERQGFAAWGTSDDGLHFRGNYYGIRAKLFVGTDPQTGMVNSASVTLGPYSAKSNLERNLNYFLLRLQRDYGSFTLRNGAYYNIDANGIIKLSDAVSDTGTQEVKVFYYSTSTFYKDALSRGLKGHVMEVVTDNPVAEDPIEHYDREGRLVNKELTDRQYDDCGYLRRALMSEKDGGQSTLDYTYDTDDRLVKRTLTNEAAGIRYVNEYTYDDDENIVSQSQKVFDKSGQCVMTINLQNDFQEFDDNGNWTRNTLKLLYWDKDSGTQQNTAEQRRTISYWE